jgi:hypothetical protein
MDAHLQAQIAFHLTGARADTCLGTIDEPPLVPALLAGFRDLATVRHAFPVVLLEGTDRAYAEPLSAVVDDVLSRAAVGADADRIRHHVLRLEERIRASVLGGAEGRLGDLWAAVSAELIAEDPSVAESLARADDERYADGDLVGCDERLPYRLLTRAWEVSRDERDARAGASIARLSLRLADILKADFENSTEGRSAAHLKSSFGTGPMDAFDFDAMSRILGHSGPRAQLPPSRRTRIEGLLETLRSQRFFRTSLTGHECYSFIFDDCDTALKAYHERFPEAIELSRAVAIAELEVSGEYDESKHDQLFATFGSDGLDSADLVMFPTYLVRLNSDQLEAHEREQLFDILSADLPFKLLVQSDDILEPSTVGDGHLAFALHSRGLASQAVGLTGVFVLQAPASSLVDVRIPIKEGLDYLGPTLISVFSGASPAAAESTPYLVAAAALESRAFPVFVYDPATGEDWAHRFSLEGNPQADQDWPVHPFAYQDADCQAATEAVTFTFVDFVAADPRYRAHFATVAPSEWTAEMVPVADVIPLEGRSKVDRVPSLLMVDDEDLLHRVIVDEKLVRESRRCLSMWHSVQELGGVRNSYAERALAEAPPTIVVEAPDGTLSAVPADTPATEPVAVATEVVEAEPERSPDEPYIETARCSTCNECTLINNTMFAYNENQQAYIADLSAGTYAQLVEAAESCQVSVIHPGKPWNPKEPGLDELLKRAEVFA